jgi:hypothetical protein
MELSVWADGVAQVVEGLSSKHEALSSNPVPPKKKKKSFLNNEWNYLLGNK